MHTQIQIFVNIATSNLPRRRIIGLLTIINDLFEAYLIGIHLGIEQILMAELLLSFEHTMTLTCGCVEILVSLLR